MSVCQLSVVLLVCFGLTVLSVHGEVPSDNVEHPASLSSRHQHSLWGYDDAPMPPKRTTRQGNRRPRPPRPDESDQFQGLDPQTNSQGSFNSNNRPFSGNQGQFNQRPNQPQFPGNRPSGQNQWGTSNGGGNQPGQNQWGTNGNIQGQNQWGTNGDNQGQNQGQNQWGSNGNNPGQNQGQNQWGSNGNNPGQNQWGTGGGNQGLNNQGNRPTTQNPTTDNQNQVQTSTAPNDEDSEAQRNTCNTSCRERITNEYNPVCGSDSQTYQNRRFLNCVATCMNIPTEVSYIGTCVSTTARTSRT